MCFEFGCLPRELEELDTVEFLELVAFIKMRDDAEKKAYEDAKRRK